MNLESLVNKIDKEKMPNHVGIIMDGNGRWAKKRGKVRLDGHYKGTEAVRRVVEIAAEINLEYLTIYAFSTENWSRPKLEVKGLLRLVMTFLLKEIDVLHKNNIKIKFIGSEVNLKKDYWAKISNICSKTWDNKGLQFNIALNYGGRTEICDAVNNIINKMEKGIIKKQKITENLINDNLYTKDIPSPDLIIRTSGEQRMSNFLLWQSAYSELFFTETLWPDYSKEEFVKAILDFQNRNRRFGAV